MKPTTHYTLGLLGFGNVLKAFAHMLPVKAEQIKEEYGLSFSVIGIATHSHGIAIDPAGIDLSAALHAGSLEGLHTGKPIPDALAFARECPADILLEATWLNPQDGQPALDCLRVALEHGRHVVTANKGPIAYGYRELKALAASKGLGFFYESTVMDGTPLHSVARESLLAADIYGIRGVLNSTTNAILNRMAAGGTFEDALREMQEAGIAEANPDNDIDGWDAAVKIAILANTIMGADLRPADVQRAGIRGIDAADVRAAAAEGTVLRLVCTAERDENGLVWARVQPTPLRHDDPLAHLEDTACAVTFYTDVISDITLREGPAGPEATAYGMLVDTINIARGRR